MSTTQTPSHLLQCCVVEVKDGNNVKCESYVWRDNAAPPALPYPPHYFPPTAPFAHPFYPPYSHTAPTFYPQSQPHRATHPPVRLPVAQTQAPQLPATQPPPPLNPTPAAPLQAASSSATTPTCARVPGVVNNCKNRPNVSPCGNRPCCIECCKRRRGCRVHRSKATAQPKANVTPLPPNTSGCTRPINTHTDDPNHTHSHETSSLTTPSFVTALSKPLFDEVNGQRDAQRVLDQQRKKQNQLALSTVEVYVYVSSCTFTQFNYSTVFYRNLQASLSPSAYRPAATGLLFWTKIPSKNLAFQPDSAYTHTRLANGSRLTLGMLSAPLGVSVHSTASLLLFSVMLTTAAMMISTPFSNLARSFGAVLDPCGCSAPGSGTTRHHPIAGFQVFLTRDPGDGHPLSVP